MDQAVSMDKGVCVYGNNRDCDSMPTGSVADSQSYIGSPYSHAATMTEIRSLVQIEFSQARLGIFTERNGIDCGESNNGRELLRLYASRAADNEPD